MICFPNAKINLGLHITEKRPDGFHSLETVFYPLMWTDALEVVENKASDEPFIYSESGQTINSEIKSNLVYKAWLLLREVKGLPPVSVHLHKNIPMGAGLGGGSSDASFFIQLASEKFGMGLDPAKKTELANRLGSDCGFFIRNIPVVATGRGDILNPVSVDLSAFYILVVYPAVHSNTAEAYRYCKPRKPEQSVAELITLPVKEWRKNLVNDFETTIFAKYPQIEALKYRMYDAGAVYASMSGSGSAVFGLFNKEPQTSWPEDYKCFVQKPTAPVL